MTHIESIEKGITDKLSHTEIIRKVYLTYPTCALIGDEERQFLILNEISSYFKIPINHVQVVGSAKTGKSFHQNAPFIPTESDLDIAIIDTELYKRYTEFVFKSINGLADRTSFRSTKDFNEYNDYLIKGIFRPDLMPSSYKRANWFRFFGELSSNHKDLFSSINAGIYMSQTFFEHKQTSIIKDYLTTKPT